MWLNLVHAVRHLRRRPVLTAVGIVSLAVGIGCALACASVVNTVLFRALPYHEPDRLVLVWENNAKRGVGLTPTSILNYEDLKSAATTFDALGAFADDARQPRRTGWLRAGGCVPHHRRPARSNARPAAHRTVVHARGGHAGRDRRGCPESWVVAAALWRRSGRRRPGDSTDRHPLYRDRRDAAGLSAAADLRRASGRHRRGDQRSRPLGAVQARRDAAPARRAVVVRARPSEGRTFRRRKTRRRRRPSDGGWRPTTRSTTSGWTSRWCLCRRRC